MHNIKTVSIHNIKTESMQTLKLINTNKTLVSIHVTQKARVNA